MALVLSDATVTPAGRRAEATREASFPGGRLPARPYCAYREVPNGTPGDGYAGGGGSLSPAAPAAGGGSGRPQAHHTAPSTPMTRCATLIVTAPLSRTLMRIPSI
jgi:hypothetical protein